MKTLVAIVTMFAAVTFAAAQTNQSDRALQNYVHALTQENGGVVASAMSNLMLYRVAKPETDFSEAIAELRKIEKEQANEVLGHKAYITRLFLERPDKFNWMDLESEEGQATLMLLDARLANQIAIIKDKKVDSLYVDAH